MLKISRRNMLMLTAGAIAALRAARPARAQTGYSPDDLKNALTPLGAERAGNADGSIPAWTGGYTDLPAGYQPGDPRPAAPFLADAKLFSITAADAPQYKDKLADGVMQLFAKFPDYRVDVYPTRRTAAAPQYVYDYTYKNASNAQIAPDGNSISNAYGGTPFPIPKDGHQVIWNHLLAWRGTTIKDLNYGFTATSDGSVTFGGKQIEYAAWPYYYPDGEADFDGFYFEFTTSILEPAYQEGAATLALQPLNPTLQTPRSWQYLVGQRRTREAPQLQYDTPNYFSSGIGNFDEFQIFNGPLDEYDFNLVGKKEMYVPYNMNKAWATPWQTQLDGHFFNPDVARWELHRVWVVEMTVKAGKRNVDARRLVYVDEDSWNGLMCDIYDSTGSLWKFIAGIPVALPDIPCVLGSISTCEYDFHAGVYTALQIIDSSIQSPWMPIAKLPKSYFTPGQLVADAGGE
jgi:hypothetical protein